ncbi:hypothetical protein AALP_AAs60001U000300 [Arabis alpina]|uniref:Uncharacterized protein n=1 Tax=Arabis alpina TaxID=50452 RepID=A0A087FZI4_ARAAL|nr:hypothetical protein AALP_AAs60001U000300 [Arabis alpina]
MNSESDRTTSGVNRNKRSGQSRKDTSEQAWKPNPIRSETKRNKEQRL